LFFLHLFFVSSSSLLLSLLLSQQLIYQQLSLFLSFSLSTQHSYSTLILNTHTQHSQHRRMCDCIGWFVLVPVHIWVHRCRLQTNSTILACTNIHTEPTLTTYDANLFACTKRVARYAVLVFIDFYKSFSNKSFSNIIYTNFFDVFFC
jgi:hypothetical protein